MGTHAGVVLAEVGLWGGFCRFWCPFAFLLAVDGQVLGTHGIGWCVQAIFMAFKAPGVMLTDLGNVAVTFC